METFVSNEKVGSPYTFYCVFFLFCWRLHKKVSLDECYTIYESQTSSMGLVYFCVFLKNVTIFTH